MAEIESCIRKFFNEEVDSGSTLSECLVTDIAAGVNSICDFTTQARCELFTEDGVYTTKDKASNLIIFGVSGGGGGGGGAQGAVLYQPSNIGGNTPSANSIDIFTLRLLQQGAVGFDGGDGGDTTFGGMLIAGGATGGEGGKIYLPGTILPRFNPIRGWGHNEDRVYLQNIVKSLELTHLKDGPMIQGVSVGAAGQGGTGTASFETRYNRDTNMWGGGDGYWGAPGNIGFKCLNATPATDYQIVIGQGGIGGANAADTVDGGDTITGATSGSDGQPGGLLVLELGF